MVPANLEMIECRGLPPTPVVVGMSPQGPALSLLYPNLPRKTEGCGVWKRKVSIILAKALSQ